MAPITTVVLAGGPPDDVARLQPGAPNKAFISIDGKPLVERVLEALRASSSVGRLIVVAPKTTQGHLALTLADERRDDGARIRESLRNGLAGLQPDELVLVATSDLPVLTVASIDDFIQRARAADPDIGYGCVERQSHLAAFPSVPHTWARLRDGVYCGAGFIVLKPAVLPQLERFIERLGAARKNPLRLASLFGIDMLARFAIGALSIRSAETRASQILHARARAIVSPFAETAVNVDRVSDVALAEELLRRSPALE